jgi:hypothetical protein
MMKAGKYWVGDLCYVFEDTGLITFGHIEIETNNAYKDEEEYN